MNLRYANHHNCFFRLEQIIFNKLSWRWLWYFSQHYATNWQWILTPLSFKLNYFNIMLITYHINQIWKLDFINNTSFFDAFGLRKRNFAVKVFNQSKLDGTNWKYSTILFIVYLQIYIKLHFANQSRILTSQWNVTRHPISSIINTDLFNYLFVLYSASGWINEQETLMEIAFYLMKRIFPDYYKFLLNR